MIREYEKGDELNLKPNEFSDFSDVADVFEDEAYKKYTLDENGEVKCILCWQEYEPKKYAIFFLMPDDVSFRHARALKKFLDDIAAKLKPKSCITYSFDCHMLNRWHEFFGFSKKDDAGVYINNQKFNKWEILWA